MELTIDKGHLAQIVLLGRQLEQGEVELRGLIDSLDVEAQFELVALMWTGREVFAPAEWQDALQTAALEAVTPTVDYLIGTPHFTDHIEAGLDALGLSLRADEEAFFAT